MSDSAGAESIHVKDEATDLDQLVLDYMSKNTTKLITQHVLLQAFSSYHLSNELLLPIINRLLQQSRITLYTKQHHSTVYYKYVERELSDKLQSLDADERMVYTLISSSGTTGVWSRDIKNKAKLNIQTCTKILKHLTSKKLIKSETTIDGTHKKIYILYELNIRSASHGTSWFVNGEFDTEYIQLIEKSIYLILNKHNQIYMSIDDINSSIEQLGIFTSTPELIDLEQLCNALCIDGTVMKYTSEDNIVKYKLCKSLESPLTWIPCNSCIVQHKCSIGGLISPSTCQYYKKWLEF